MKSPITTFFPFVAHLSGMTGMETGRALFIMVLVIVTIAVAVALTRRPAIPFPCIPGHIPWSILGTRESVGAGIFPGP